MRTELRDYLLADSAIAGRVGARVYPVQLPQKPGYPAITYQVISGSTEEALNTRSRLRRNRVQVDAWAETYGEAAELAELVRERLDGAKATQGGIHIASSWMGIQTDIFEDSIRRYRVTCDFDLVWWSV